MADGCVVVCVDVGIEDGVVVCTVFVEAVIVFVVVTGTARPQPTVIKAISSISINMNIILLSILHFLLMLVIKFRR